jgi:hypothetical protein
MTLISTRPTPISFAVLAHEVRVGPVTKALLTQAAGQAAVGRMSANRVLLAGTSHTMAVLAAEPVRCTRPLAQVPRTWSIAFVTLDSLRPRHSSEG